MVKNKKKWKNDYKKKHAELLLMPKEVVMTLTLNLQPKQNLGKV
jgi:hypothetical protein